MNYTLFVLIFAVGIWSYSKTPKEIFPSFDLDMISIKGSYIGASVDILDKMVVSEIVIMKSNGRSKLLDFIKEKKFNFSDLVNIRSIKESVNWLAAQDLQLKESPVIHYYKKTS